MAEGPEPQRRQSVEDALKDVKLEGSYREHFINLVERLTRDDEAMIVLKGHLVIEERLTAAVERELANA